MTACNKCSTEKDVALVTVSMVTEAAKAQATGELCPACLEGLAAAVTDAGLPIELVAVTSRGLGASH